MRPSDIHYMAFNVRTKKRLAGQNAIPNSATFSNFFLNTAVFFRNTVAFWTMPCRHKIRSLLLILPGKLTNHGYSNTFLTGNFICRKNSMVIVWEEEKVLLRWAELLLATRRTGPVLIPMNRLPAFLNPGLVHIVRYSDCIRPIFLEAAKFPVTPPSAGGLGFWRVFSVQCQVHCTTRDRKDSLQHGRIHCLIHLQPHRQIKALRFPPLKVHFFHLSIPALIMPFWTARHDPSSVTRIQAQQRTRHRCSHPHRYLQDETRHRRSAYRRQRQRQQRALPSPASLRFPKALAWASHLASLKSTTTRWIWMIAITISIQRRKKLVQHSAKAGRYFRLERPTWVLLFVQWRKYLSERTTLSSRRLFLINAQVQPVCLASKFVYLYRYLYS